MNDMTKLTAISVVLAATLTGCGHTTGERAVSGAGLGAAAGTVGAAVAGGGLGAGAAIGAAAGAAAGALTDDEQVDLGEPAWKK